MRIGTSVLLDEPEIDEVEELEVKLPIVQKSHSVKKTFFGIPPKAKAEDCLATSEFPHMEFLFEYFNPVQTEFIKKGIDNDHNVVVSSATSSGKTVIAETVIAHTLKKIRLTHPNAKAVYISPLRALCTEKYQTWSSDHSFAEYSISILTGDYVLTKEKKAELLRADIILMSSEMLGSRIRREDSEHNVWLTQDTKVLVIDECHLLTSSERGPNQEVALMKFTKVNPSCRLIGLSATMPNVEEIGGWFTHLNNKESTVIKNSYRPVDLDVHFEMYPDGGRYKQTEEIKQDRAISIVNQYPKDKFIVFVHTKKTGYSLYEKFRRQGIVCEFHNADVNKEERGRIEREFRSKDPSSLRVVIATSTLAWGCFHENTYVALSNGVYKKIKDIKKNERVLSYNIKNGQVEGQKVICTGTKQHRRAYNLSVSNGEDFMCSINHPILSCKDGDISFIPANKIKKGDFVGCLSAHKKFTKKGYTQKQLALSRILGIMFGDGCLYYAGKHHDGAAKVGLDIAAHKSELRCIQYIKEQFRILDPSLGKEEWNCTSYTTDGVLHLRTKRRKISSILLRYLVPKNYLKQFIIPTFIINNKTLLKEFLKWLFFADGSVEKQGKTTKGRIGFCTINKDFCQQVRFCLLKLGIYSKIYRRKRRGKKARYNGKWIISKHASYSLLIWGKELIKFYDIINFPPGSSKGKRLFPIYLSFKKAYKPYNRLQFSPDRIPLGKYIDQYLKEKGVIKNKFKKYGDAFSIGHTIHAVNREVVRKFKGAFGTTPQLEKLLNDKIRWERVTKKRTVLGGTFYDLSVEKNKSYVANTIFVHNCNFPARRVVIVGITRGLNLVDSLDIHQSAGRSGRIGLDDKGDAHILINNNKAIEEMAHCKKIEEIRSKLGERKIFAFHLISEIAEKTIKTIEDAVMWYVRSLLHFQSIFESEEHAKLFITEAFEELEKYGAIKRDVDGYSATKLGLVASWYYLSPYDVYGWAQNFKTIMSSEFQSEDIAWALANIDTYLNEYDIVINDPLYMKLSDYLMCHNRPLRGGVGKKAFAYYCLLKNISMEQRELYSVMAGTRMDMERISSAIKTIGNVSKMFEGCQNKHLTLELPYRLRYGIENVELVLIPGVGTVTARKMMGRRIFNCKELLMAQEMGQNVLTPEKWGKVKDVVKQIANIGYLNYLKYQDK